MKINDTIESNIIVNSKYIIRFPPAPLQKYDDKQSNIRSIYKSIYKKYKNKLIFFAVDIVHSKEIADDIVQDLFLHLWLKKIDLTADWIESYLYTAIKNRCLNYLRHKRVEDKTCNQWIHSQEAYSGIEGEESGWEKEMTLVLKKIDKLPDHLKIVIILRLKEGLTNQEIAEYLNISLKTVEYRFHKVKIVLLKKLPVK